MKSGRYLKPISGYLLILGMSNAGKFSHSLFRKPNNQYGNKLYTVSKTPPKIWHTLFLLFYYSIISKENWMFTLHRQIFTAISLAKAVFCPSCIIKDLFILTFNIPWITQPPISFSLLWNFARSAWFATRMSQGVEMKPSLWAMNMV